LPVAAPDPSRERLIVDAAGLRRRARWTLSNKGANGDVLVTAKRRASTFHLFGEPPKVPRNGRNHRQVIEFTCITLNERKHVTSTTAMKKASTKVRRARRNVTVVTSADAAGY